VVNQTYSNIEIIAIDDGILDNSFEIAKSFQEGDERIKVVKQNNSGIHFTRMRGVEIAYGEAILFLDHDDELALNAVELLVAKMKKEKADVVIGNHFHLEKGKSTLVKNEIPPNNEKADIFSYLLLGKLRCYVWARLFKRHLLMNLSAPYDMIWGEDVFTNFDLVSRNKVKLAILEEGILNYYIHEANTINSDKPDIIESAMDQIEWVERILERHQLLEKLSNEKAAFNCRTWIVYCRMGGLKSKNKDYFKAFKDKYYPKARKHLALYQRIEMEAYGINYNFGKFTTKSMKWIKQIL
jgi:glycosyltransferase involved in cell wall biosynthesis